MDRITKDIRYSATLSSNFYSSEESFKNVIDNIFVHSWHFITDDEEFTVKDYAYPFILMQDVLPEPLFLIMNNDQLNCFSNVCTHRGNILINDKGKLNKNIVCRYHGRSFNLNGKFISMPCTEGMKDFPTSRDNLPSISANKWKKFIFCSIDPKFSINDLMLDVEKRVAWMPIQDFVFREDLSNIYTVNANWALYCDNYLEGFHIPFIHEDLNKVLDYNNYRVETFKYSNLQIGYANDGDVCFDLPEDSPDYGMNIAAYYFWLFPNIMLNFYPWGLSVNIITPLSISKTKVEFKSYVWKDNLLNKGAGADVNKVELEDQQVVESVQKGINSRLYSYGRFSPKMEQGVHHFHNLVKEFMQ